MNSRSNSETESERTVKLVLEKKGGNIILKKRDNVVTNTWYYKYLRSEFLSAHPCMEVFVLIKVVVCAHNPM